MGIRERRWRAALSTQINLKVVVKSLNDFNTALIQIMENDNKKNLSDFAKARSLLLLIDDYLLNQNDLVLKIDKSKQYISALFAAKIKQLCFKGENYNETIMSLKVKIIEGK